MTRTTIEYVVDDVISAAKNVAYDGALPEKQREAGRLALNNARQRLIDHFNRSVELAKIK